MGLFHKKDKNNKKKKSKKGCLKKLGIFALFVAVFVVGAINGFKNIENLYGEQISTVKSYIEAINEEPNVAEIITNPVATYAEFQDIASASGFSGYANLDWVLYLNSTMQLRDNVFGALLNNYINQKDEFMSVGELTVVNDNTLKVVAVYNLTSIKSLLSSAGDILPDKLYVTTTYTYSIIQNVNGDNQISVSGGTSILNQLSQTQHDTILKYLMGIDSETNTSSFNIIDTYLFSAINDMAIKTESSLTLVYQDHLGYFYFTK